MKLQDWKKYNQAISFYEVRYACKKWKYWSKSLCEIYSKLIIYRKDFTMFLLTKNGCHTVCTYATQCFEQLNAG